MRGGGEVAVDVETAVGDPSEHVDTVGQDEPNAAEKTSEEERGAEEDEGEHQHDPVVPAAEETVQEKLLLLWSVFSNISIKGIDRNFW